MPSQSTASGGDALIRPVCRDDRKSPIQNNKSQSAPVEAALSRTCDGSVGQRAGAAESFYKINSRSGN
jgi:hypothetical protein